MYRYLKKKAQSTAEYVIILGLIVGAVVAMQTYIKRGMQGRIQETVDATGDAIIGAGGVAVSPFSGEQYEPYYLGSHFESESNTAKKEELHLDGSIDRTDILETSTRSGNQTIGAGDPSVEHVQN